MSDKHKREPIEGLSYITSLSLEQASTEEILSLETFEMETDQIHEQRKEKNFMDALLDELDTPSHENLLFWVTALDYLIFQIYKSFTILIFAECFP